MNIDFFKKEKVAMMLVPEISLTPQTVDRFVGRFGKEKIAVLHSKLSIGERHDEWERIKENKAKIKNMETGEETKVKMEDEEIMRVVKPVD